MTSDTYFRVGFIIGAVVAVVTFIGSWWYCAANYGFLLGFGLGWLPAAIAAAIAGGLAALLWGPVLLLIGFGVLWLVVESSKERPRPPEAARALDPDESPGYCVERKDAAGVVTSYVCGDVILPVGPPVEVLPDSAGDERRPDLEAQPPA